MPTTLPPRALAFCLAVLFSGPATGLDLEGTLRLREDGKLKQDREVRFAVVYYEPQAPAPAPAAPAQPFAITMSRKAFEPRVLAVPVGSRVAFPNDDRILHNVFSLSPGNRFDLGLYRRGESAEALISSPGVVQVFCNVHHSMVAYVVALETPHYTHPDADGRFVLRDLPEGPGRLIVWHERADPLRRDLDLPLAAALDLEVELTKPRVPPHRNKFGKPYKRRRGRAY